MDISCTPRGPRAWQDTVGIEAQLVAAHAKHGGKRWAIDVRIDDTHAPALQGEKHRQICGDGTLTHPALAAHHSDSMLDPGHAGFEPGYLLSHLPGHVGATIASNVPITLRHRLPRNAKRGTVSRAPR